MSQLLKEMEHTFDFSLTRDDMRRVVSAIVLREAEVRQFSSKVPPESQGRRVLESEARNLRVLVERIEAALAD